MQGGGTKVIHLRRLISRGVISSGVLRLGLQREVPAWSFPSLGHPPSSKLAIKNKGRGGKQ